MPEHLQFSPNILRRLGEELVPDIDQGIIELVKNAYDADATKCEITLDRLLSGDGVISISDNGVGMGRDQIKRGWLVIGRSSKSKDKTTKRYKRVPVGDKGLGRLAALRLGSKVRLTTRPASEPNTEYELVLDWTAYEQADVVEEVPLRIVKRGTDDPSGTSIQIEGISAKVTRTTVNKLARSLLLLSDPFATSGEAGATDKKLSPSQTLKDPGFVALLTTPDFKDLQAKVGHSYFSDAEYRIQAEVSETGSAIFRILDWKGDIFHENYGSSTFYCPPFKFDLWSFVLKTDSFSTRTSTLTEVRNWLSEVGGVHVYEDGIRVPPYGGSENDWLSLNLRRARSPEVRPSTNTSVGRVKLSNANGMLIQKTDRVGYVENYAFNELKRACGEALDWAARVMLRERDKKREAEKTSKKEKTGQATKSLESVLSQAVPATERKRVDKAIESLLKASEKETESLREELQLYRSLATAGMISAVFAHEVGRPLELINDSIKSLTRLIPDNKKEVARVRANRAKKQKEHLNSFVSIPLQLLNKRKRRSGRISVNSAVRSMKVLVQPVADYYETAIELHLEDSELAINGTEAILDGIILNLLLNSFNAFQREGYIVEQRQVRIETKLAVDAIVIRVSDNAGGIDGVLLDDIWLPGVTTSADGTGFGLTIVRDSVQDLNGTVDAVALSHFGGAQFTIQLPPMRELFTH